MEKNANYLAGIDLGTNKVRVVVGNLGEDGSLNIVGNAEIENAGMKKGTVADIAGVVNAVNEALREVDNLVGTEIRVAAWNINGAHIACVKTEGMVAAGATVDHVITEHDIDWVNKVAVTGKALGNNREQLVFAPFRYVLDGESETKNPLDMSGSRLEVKANVVSGLKTHCDAVVKVAEMAKVYPLALKPGVLVAANVVLSERQLENGVALVDLGATTTNVAVFEGGDLQHVAVVPVGSNHITNDLAQLLGVPIEIAEEIKSARVSMSLTNRDKDITLKSGREELRFDGGEVYDIIEARVQQILTAVRAEIKRAGYDRKLPEGVVLIGGGAKLKDIADYAREVLESYVQVGRPTNMTGVTKDVENPEYAVAVGLMCEMSHAAVGKHRRGGGKNSPGLFSKIARMFVGGKS
jgi:cell division protein FtsA